MKTLVLLIAVSFCTLVASKPAKKSLHGQIVHIDHVDNGLERSAHTDNKLDHFVKIHMRSEDGQKVEFELTQNRKLRRDIPIETDQDNKTRSIDEVAPHSSGKTFQERHQFYHDRAHHRRAVIALTDDGQKLHMRGTFKHEGAHYQVEPVENHPTNGHMVKKNELRHPVDYKAIDGFAKRKNEDPVPVSGAPNGTTADGINSQRQKRNSADNYVHPSAFNIELMLIVDYSFYMKCKEDANFVSAFSNAEECVYYRLSFIMNGMDMSYADIKTFNIDTWAKLIHISTTKDGSYWTEDNKVNGDSTENRVWMSEVLDSVCKWTIKQGYDWTDYDHYMMFTTYDIGEASGGQWQAGTIGLAYTNQVCYPGLQCSIIEDTGFAGNWITTTHELGHNLGSDHDHGSGDCDEDMLHIMTSYATVPGQDKVQNIDTFSTCSEEEILANLYGTSTYTDATAWPRVCTYNAVCANDDSNVHWTDNKSDYPGQKLSLDVQCVMAAGDEWKWHDTGASEYADVCREITCATEPNWKGRYYTKQTGTAAVDGTYCNDAKTKWCIHKECVSTSDETPVKGGTTKTVTESHFKCGGDLTPPSSVEDNQYQTFSVDGNTLTCSELVAQIPYHCYATDVVRTECAASCYKRGFIEQ